MNYELRVDTMILQLKMSIDGTDQPDYKPLNDDGYDTLDNSETKEFCIGSKLKINYIKYFH